VFGSCFHEECFATTAQPPPALSPPEAFALSEELPASLSTWARLASLHKLMAAFKSRSSTSPQAPSGLRQ